MHVLHGAAQRLLRPGKLRVSGAALLHTFDQGGKLVRGLDDAAQLLLVRPALLQKGTVGGAQILRQHGEQAASRVAFHLRVGAAQSGVIVFDGRGKISCEDLGRVVEQGERGGPLGRNAPAEALVAQEGQRVGEHRRLKAVLTEVFLPGAAHEPPAADMLHA